MYYDDVILKVGKITNRFQIILFCLLTYRFFKYDTIYYMFMTLKTGYHCDWNSTLLTNQNSSQIIGEMCDQYNCSSSPRELPQCAFTWRGNELKCNKWIFDNYNTIISEFNLVCGKKYLVNMIQGAFWVGKGMTLILGILSDRFGRRKLILAVSFIDVLVAVGIAAAQDPYSLIFLRFLNGVCIEQSKVSLILYQELSNPQSRIIAGNAWWLMYTVGLCFAALIAYLIPYWRYMQTFLVLWLVFMVLYPFYVPESPRWLLAKQKNEEAQEMIDWVCDKNKMDHVSLDGVKVSEFQSKKIQWHLLRNKAIVLRILFSIFSILSVNMIYYGMTLNVEFASDNPYLSTFLMGIAEFPAIPVGIFLVKLMGYRCALSFLCGLTSLMIFVVPFTKAIGALWSTLAVVGKTTVSAAFSIVIIYITELFPTDLRNSGMLSSSLARFSGFAIPYINDLRDVHFYYPSAIYGSIGVLLCIMIIPFPEIRGAPLIQSISEMPSLEWKLMKRPQTVLESAVQMDAINNGFVTSREHDEIS